MKYCLSLFLILISFCTYAQNALFIPFGQTVAQVDSFIDSKDYIKQINQPEENITEIVIHEGRKLRYHFDDGFLYEIEEIRLYTNHKIKETLIKNCMDYLKSTEEKVKVLKTEGVDSHYAVAPDDRVIEFSVTDKGKKKTRQIAITLKSTSRFHGPRLDTEQYAAGIEE